jgi:predicted amidohydrolase YtcJ
LVWSAVNRKSYAGTDVGPEQRISVYEALEAVTIDSAWQMFLEDDRGSIEVGKFADFVVLDKNPLDDPQGVKDIKVMETIVGGKSVYKR